MPGSPIWSGERSARQCNDDAGAPGTTHGAFEVQRPTSLTEPPRRRLGDTRREDHEASAPSPSRSLVLVAVVALVLGSFGTATAAGSDPKGKVKKIAAKVVNKKATTLTVARAANATNGVQPDELAASTTSTGTFAFDDHFAMHGDRGRHRACSPSPSPCRRATTSPRSTRTAPIRGATGSTLWCQLDGLCATTARASPTGPTWALTTVTVRPGTVNFGLRGRRRRRHGSPRGRTG